jgi:putative flippase GtrA
MPDFAGIHLQAWRFAVVGLTSNAVLYLATSIGPKVAMSLVYGIGVAQTFLCHKRWTFSHRGSTGVSMLRYLIAYALGCLLNFGVLYFFVDVLGLPHQAVQGGAIIGVAVTLFFLQRYWVFPGCAENPVSKTV